MAKTAEDRSTGRPSPDSDSGKRYGEVMAAIDDAGDVSRFVIADISRDGVWISILASEALSLPAWR